MVWQYPPTAKQLAGTGCCFALGLALIGVGAHLSYANIEPQRARAKARADFVRDYIRRKLGD
ncbi:hypothetical protein J5N97_029065 [Dioscorea zingiberensis]|uniref:Uncharacterized protein n=1 Tax=Dioscorea zingiberensis TaxID=325984 RepID=A0A9D5C043_9LILI|nr:hypothetical protein J5N97_029065 [Dioscorea zingiberensis]